LRKVSVDLHHRLPSLSRLVARAPRRTILILFILPALLLTATYNESQEIANTTHGPGHVAAWLVDWDLDGGLEEWRTNADAFDELHLFAVYFDGDGNPFAPDNWTSLPNELRSWRQKAPGRSIWITAVNDRVSPDQRIQKDPDLVHQFIESPQQRRRHIEDLAAIVRKYDANGIELDYENLRPEDWPAYLEFIGEAKLFFADHGIGLQVVLQPQQIALRDSPDDLLRTVMSYNLHGIHSGPGPKNTPDLVQRIAGWIGRNRIPGFRIAFATGGFDWVGEKVVRQVRELDALKLQREFKASIRRTPSGNASFSYTDAKGENHQVWFEDATSFRRQWRTASEAGFTELAIWRLGGNSPELFDFLREERTKARR
jgi:spore germination protein YaaH